MRGLDYYTRTVFEFTSDALGAQSGVGGRRALRRPRRELGGPATPGMGWAAGVERILLAGVDRPPSRHRPSSCSWRSKATARPRAGAAFGLLAEARSADCPAQMDLAGRSLKGQLGHADALGARYVAIVGEQDAVLKDMEGGGQEQIAADAVVHAVLRGHHAL